MIGIYNYIGSKGEDIRDLMRKADDKTGKGELLYVGPIQFDGSTGDLHHFLSSTVVVMGNKERSRATVFAPMEDEDRIKEGLANKLGITLI